MTNAKPTVPDGVPPAFKLKDASRLLRGFDERTLMRWCRSGFLKGFPANPDGGKGGKWWVPAAEVARLAALMMIEPDWEAGM